MAASGELCELAKVGKREAIESLLKANGDVNAADYDHRALAG